MRNNQRLPRSTPEREGILSSAILAFVDAIEQNGCELHSLMVLRHGSVVAEGWWLPYAPERGHILFSLSKSFTSTAIGLAMEEGRLAVDDRVLSFFAEEAPPTVSENLAAMRVRDLLTMTTGHGVDTTGSLHECADGNWVRAFLALPVDYVPGSHFVYNSGATYMLSAILQRLTGMTLLDYLTPRLLEPLGIEDATWEVCPRGINVGGWGLKIKTEDIACFGLMYLHKGLWQGQRLVPEAWVAEATAYQVANNTGDPNAKVDWTQGYGYQFWRCRHNAYRGDGAFGQYCIVMPDQDAVLAITSGVSDMQTVLDLVWEHLLPAMHERALAEDAATLAKLERRLNTLALPLLQGQPAPTTLARASHQPGRRYVFAPNDQKMEWVALHQDGPTWVLSWRDENGEQSVRCGSGERLLGSVLFRNAPTPATINGAWTDAQSYTVQMHFVETPFCATISLRFGEESVEYQFKWNVSFGPTEYPPLVGKLVDR